MTPNVSFGFKRTVVTKTTIIGISIIYDIQ